MCSSTIAELPFDGLPAKDTCDHLISLNVERTHSYQPQTSNNNKLKMNTVKMSTDQTTRVPDIEMGATATDSTAANVVEIHFHPHRRGL